MYDPKKRKAELAELLQAFETRSKQKGDEFTYKENPVDLILGAYEKLLDVSLKPAHVDDTNLNIYKVASGLEMAINYVRPIQTSSVFLFEALNAQLAVDVAFSFVFSKKLTNVDIQLNESELSVYREHHEILTYANPEAIFGSAVLVNSSFWRAFYLCVFQRLDSEGILK
jgi:hypothetical protein